MTTTSTSSICLRVHKRRLTSGSSEDWNLFARLAPQVALELYQELVVSSATNSYRMEEEDKEDSIRSKYQYADINFLPLAVTLASGETVYTSYNGGDCRTRRNRHNVATASWHYHHDEDDDDDALGDRIIDLPVCLLEPHDQPGGASVLNESDTAEDTERPLVLVRALPRILRAIEIHVEPVTPADWVLIESHAKQLEQGHLLQQVSVVAPNQILELSLGDSVAVETTDRMIARVRILPEGFERRCVDEDKFQTIHSNVVPSFSNPWSDDYDHAVAETATAATESFVPCRCLVADTRIVVRPPVPTAEQPNSRHCLVVHPTQLDYGKAMNELAGQLGRVLPQVEQRTVIMHPSYLKEAPECRTPPGSTILAKILLSQPTSGSSSYECVRVQGCESLARGYVALHPMIRQQHALDVWKDSVTIELLDPLAVNTLIGAFHDVIAQGTSFYLERVDVILKRAEAPWRYPAEAASYRNDDIENEGGSLDLQGGVVQNGSVVAANNLGISLHPPAHLGDLPIQIGSLIHLPWNSQHCFSSRTNCVYRLMSAAISEQKEGEALENGILFSKDLCLLLAAQLSPEAHALSQSLPVQIMKASSPLILKRSPYLSNCLMCEGFVATSLRETLFKLLSTSSAEFFVLFQGASGSGKSYAALLLAATVHLSLPCSVVYLDCRRLKDTRETKLNTILDEIAKVFRAAMDASPAVIVLDELDEIAPSYETGGRQDDSAQVEQANPALIDQCKSIESIIRYMMDTVSYSGLKVYAFATCKNIEGLSRYTRSSIAFDQVVNLPLLSKNDRTSLFKYELESAMLKRRRVGWLIDRFPLPDFSRNTADFRPRDFQRLAIRLSQCLCSTSADLAINSAAEEVMGQYVPLCMLSAATEAKRSTALLSDVGGLFDVKRELTNTILRPSRYHRIFSKVQIRLPKGILLFGPPGCGKTFIVPALARECGFPLLVCHGPELLDKYIGASEAKVRELFSRAASIAPSIVFLDELDALAPRRGSDSTGVTDRIVNQLLTILDGVEESKSATGTVYVVAASSRPDKIDPALLRPGRLERHLYVGHPEQDAEWHDLLLKIARRHHVETNILDSIGSGELLADMRKVIGSFLLSPADVWSIFSTAKVVAAYETLASISNETTVGDSSPGALIGLGHLQQALNVTKPSLSLHEWSRLQTIYRPFQKASVVITTEDVTSSKYFDSAVQSLRVAFK